jgi:hypothetical protein
MKLESLNSFHLVETRAMNYTVQYTSFKDGL